MPNNKQQKMEYQEWSLVYSDYDPAKEKSRESLLAVGNGYLGIRGAMEEAKASDLHYPGTYLAGLYNRLTSVVSGKEIDNEDLVNCPNSLFLTFRVAGGEWFDPEHATILSIRRELDFKTGVLLREMVVEDAAGRQTEIISQRLASMENPHLVLLRYAVKPLNYSGLVEVLSEIDARIINDGVVRYRSLNQKHLDTLDQGFTGDTDWVRVKTTQSDLEVAMTARHRVVYNGQLLPLNAGNEMDQGQVSRMITIEMGENQTLVVEKLVSVYTSKPDDSTDPHAESLLALVPGYTFDDLVKTNAERWREIWDQIDIRIVGDPKSQMLIRLHLYHLMVTASPHNVHIDAGIPARGLHGEAYRGHIFWDELYILPLYHLFLPDVAKSVLRYRYRRLDEARENARQHGYAGAMFPWQSGSDGREETQVIHLNPLSGEWGDDYSSLQRHISLAIAYNVWYYYQITEDQGFMEHEGAELFLEICRFWASKCSLNEAKERYEISRVMGPDEFHEQHPLSENGGVRNNAYTNLMVAWLFEQVAGIWNDLSQEAQYQLQERLQISPDEMDHWRNMSGKLYLDVSKEGIIAQFEGFLKLKELDWDAYRKKYGNIHRLDRILKAEGKSPDAYQLAKQADTLMTFYNLNQSVVSRLMEHMGYATSDSLLRDNYQYYIDRTSHGSTLSRVVHAYLALEMGDPALAWELYSDALASDYTDIQGGTTAEGIHAGVMGGTVLMVLTAFSGFDFREDTLRINPRLPDQWDEVAFRFQFKGTRFDCMLTKELLQIETISSDNSETEIEFLNKTIVLQPGKMYRFNY